MDFLNKKNYRPSQSAHDNDTLPLSRKPLKDVDKTKKGTLRRYSQKLQGVRVRSLTQLLCLALCAVCAVCVRTTVTLPIMSLAHVRSLKKSPLLPKRAIQFHGRDGIQQQHCSGIPGVVVSAR